MINELYDFVSDFKVARLIREMAEDNSPMLICGPDRQTCLEFFSLVLRNRPRLQKYLGIFKTEDLLFFHPDQIKHARFIEIKNGDPSLKDLLQSGLRQDIDGFFISEVGSDPESLFTLLSALLTGHTISTTIISTSATIESTSAALAKSAGENAAQFSAAFMPFNFVELIPTSEFTPLSRICRMTDTGLSPLIQRVIIPHIPGRDPYMEGFGKRYEIITAASPLAASLHWPLLKNVNDIKAWNEVTANLPEVKSLEGRRALVPLSKMLTAEEKQSLITTISDPTSWPTSEINKKKMFLLAQIEVAQLPADLKKDFAANQVIQFFMIPYDESGMTNVDYFAPFSSAFKIRSLPTAQVAPSTLPVNILREHYQIASWTEIRDFPHWEDRTQADDQTAQREDICFGGNKVGGWPWWVQARKQFKCRQCEREMKFLLQIDGWEGEFQGIIGDFKLQFSSARPTKTSGP